MRDFIGLIIAGFGFGIATIGFKICGEKGKDIMTKVFYDNINKPVA